MDLEKLPKALKNKNIFCSWKYEHQENGRLTKPPYNPITGKKAAIDSLSDFSSLDAAMKVKDQAKEIISHFKHAYIEYSPSKHGFHILLLFNGTYDKKAYYIKHGVLRKHLATDLITKVSPVFYDLKPRSERFSQFVDEIMSGDCEKELTQKLKSSHRELEQAKARLNPLKPLFLKHKKNVLT